MLNLADETSELPGNVMEPTVLSGVTAEMAVAGKRDLGPWPRSSHLTRKTKSGNLLMTLNLALLATFILASWAVLCAWLESLKLACVASIREK